MTISRRSFLCLSASVALPYFGVSIYASNVNKFNIVNFLDFSDSTLIVGRCYVESYYSKDSVESLINTMPVCDSIKTWNSSIKSYISNDFNNNNVIQLKGWILARTEVNLAALTWLLYKKHKL